MAITKKVARIIGHEIAVFISGLSYMAGAVVGMILVLWLLNAFETLAVNCESHKDMSACIIQWYGDN